MLPKAIDLNSNERKIIHKFPRYYDKLFANNRIILRFLLVTFLIFFKPFSNVFLYEGNKISINYSKLENCLLNLSSSCNWLELESIAKHELIKLTTWSSTTEYTSLNTTVWAIPIKTSYRNGEPIVRCLNQSIK